MPSISLIVPAHNPGHMLQRCLDALVQSTRPPNQVIVVDDCSTDNSIAGAVAGVAADFQRAGISLVVEPSADCDRLTPRGPAAARNAGARHASGAWLFFVDCDVVLHCDALALAEEYMLRYPYLSGLFGSYDDSPSATGSISQYKNLVHYLTHHQHPGPTTTFWSGCGLVRKKDFWSVGGFDERFERPSIEDIDLGQRLSAQGKILHIVPTVQATHLKQWSLRNWLYTDVVHRAIPWSRLIVQQRALPTNLNLDWSNRLSVPLAWLIVPVAASLAWRPRIALSTAFALLGVLWMLNRRLIKLLWKRGGGKLALQGALYHWLYYLYSSATLAGVLLTHVATQWIKRTWRRNS